MGMDMGNIAVQAPPAIYGAIAGVIADVGHVAKDKINKQQGFKFRSIDDVYNALHPALAKNKVFIVPTILERNCEVVGKTQKGTDMIKVICKIEFNFYAEDGSSVKSIIYGEGLDTGDKATNKAMAIAYKYACFQVFCIPTEEMVDPDGESLELDGNKSRGSNKSKSSVSKQKQEKEQQDIPCENGKELVSNDIISADMLNEIREEQTRTGVSDQVILSRKQVEAKKIEELTVEEYEYIMSVFKKTPDKKGDSNE